MVETELMYKLRNKLDSYNEDLLENGNILREAADVCLEAMGRDPVSMKHIEKLNEALKKLNRAKGLVQEAINLLDNDIKKAIDIVEDI